MRESLPNSDWSPTCCSLKVRFSSERASRSASADEWFGMESYRVVGKEGRAVGSGSYDFSIITAANLIMNESFFLFLLLLGLHHVWIARKLLIRELPLSFLEKVLVLGKAKASSKSFDVDVDLHLCESFLDLSDLFQLVEALLRVAVVTDDLGKSSSSLCVLAQRGSGLSGLLLSQVQKLAKLALQGVQTVPADGLLVERSEAREFVEGKVELCMSWAGSSHSCKSKAKLILKPNLFLDRRWFFAEAIDRFEFHFFQLFLHLFCNFGLALGPLVSHFRLQGVFPLPTQSFVVLPDVAKLHSSLFFGFDALIEHVGFLVLLLLVHSHCVDVNWVLGLQLVWHLFDWLVFIGLFWFFAEPAHVWHSWLLFLRVFSWNCRWLAFSWWNLSSFSWRRHAFLALERLLWLLFLWLFVLWRHWIEHSWRSLILLVFCKGGDIDGLPLVLSQPLGRVIELRMQRTRVPAIRLHNAFNEVERNVELLLNLLYLLLFRQPRDISIKLAHLISHVSLFGPLLHQSRLLLEPSIQVLQCHHLVLPRFQLRNIRKHRVQLLI